MLKLLKRLLFGGDKEQPDQEDIFQTIIEKIGVDNELNTKNFLPAKARKVELVTSAKSLTELESALLDGARCLPAGLYIPEKWKVVHPRKKRFLDNFISDGDELLHPLDWVETHRHLIIRLVDAYLKMDRADREYYHRFTSFIIEDILSVLNASEDCVR